MAPLAILRRQRLLSQRDLAGRAQVTLSTVHLTENGKSVPRLGVMRRICEALGVEPSDVDEFRAAIGQGKSEVHDLNDFARELHQRVREADEREALLHMDARAAHTRQLQLFDQHAPTITEMLTLARDMTAKYISTEWPRRVNHQSRSAPPPRVYRFWRKGTDRLKGVRIVIDDTRFKIQWSRDGAQLGDLDLSAEPETFVRDLIVDLLPSLDRDRDRDSDPDDEQK